MGSLSLLQVIFLIQKLNQGLLHCRQILYQLSYEGSPSVLYMKESLDQTIRYSNSASVAIYLRKLGQVTCPYQ